MIYKFRSKAAGDVLMLGPNGDELLRLIGREPAAQGIIEPSAMPAVLAALQSAAAADDAARSAGSGGDAGGPAAVSVRQRVWPMVEMLKRAEAAGHPVVWGV
jgi:hypothetical protein